MARKINSPADVETPFAGSAPLTITEWDEGSSSSHGWIGIEITYRRQHASRTVQPLWSPLRAVLDDPDDLSRR